MEGTCQLQFSKVNGKQIYGLITIWPNPKDQNLTRGTYYPHLFIFPLFCGVVLEIVLSPESRVKWRMHMNTYQGNKNALFPVYYN